MGAAGLFVVAAVLRPDVAVALVVLGGGFTLLERWRPLRPQPPAFRREGAATDAGAFVIDQVLVAAAATVVVALLAPVLGPVVPRALPEALGSLPGWARWLIAFGVAELCGYWSHRISHEVPFLWRFHAVHHSAPELDWLAPSRRHPVDAMFSAASTTLPILLLGLSPPAVVSVFALRRIQGLLLHANLNCRLGPLEWIVATPFFHHWHHTGDPGRWDCNYAGSVPALDWLFGSLHLPEEWPEGYGCDVAVPATGYFARLASPWVGPDGRSLPDLLAGPLVPPPPAAAEG
jgi:sterol desaturase/sphingolipid hydroxylase (fatty acid hydroxylase superfamily)